MVMEKQRNENMLDTQKTNRKLEDVNLNLSVITLHVNGLTNPIKKQMDRCVEKYDPAISYIQGKHFRLKDTSRLKAKEWKKTFKQKPKRKKKKQLEWLYEYQKRQTLRQKLLPNTKKVVL